MKMSIFKLSDLRDLCKDPKNIEKVRDFLEKNPAMDLIGEGHGGAFRAAIKANNPEAIKALIHYHRTQKMDIYDVGTTEYNKALWEFKQVFEEILAENWHFIKEEYIFSNEVKQALAEEHVLPEEDGEQDLGLEEEIEALSDCEFDDTLLEDVPNSSIHHNQLSGEADYYSGEMC